MNRKPLNLKIVSCSNDGMVDILVDGDQYIYFIDAVYITTFLNKARMSSGAALNFLKDRSRACEKITKNNNTKKMAEGEK